MRLRQALIDGEVWYGREDTPWLTYDPSMLPHLPTMHDNVGIIGGTVSECMVARRMHNGLWKTSYALIEVSIVQARIERFTGHLERNTKPHWWVDDLQRAIDQLNMGVVE